MSDVTVLAINLIVSNPNVRSGKPIIDGTTLRVQDVVEAHFGKHYQVEEIAQQYRLTLAQVHAALTYYYQHQDEIDGQIGADLAFAEQAKEQGLGQRHPPIFR